MQRIIEVSGNFWLLLSDVNVLRSLVAVLSVLLIRSWSKTRPTQEEVDKWENGYNREAWKLRRVQSRLDKLLAKQRKAREDAADEESRRNGPGKML